MDDKTQLVQPEQIEQAVLLIRGQRVMLDRDLAALYGVTTSNLNKAVKRNLDRFPADFMFQLTMDEVQAVAGSRFQIGILKKGQNIKYLPYAFMQEGVAMLSSVLRSPRAAQVNIAIMRVFVRLRETLALHKDLAHKLAQLERKIEGHDASIHNLFDAIRQLMTPPEKPRREIGFHAIPRTRPIRAKRKQNANETPHRPSTINYSRVERPMDRTLRGMARYYEVDTDLVSQALPNTIFGWLVVFYRPPACSSRNGMVQLFRRKRRR